MRDKMLVDFVVKNQHYRIYGEFEICMKKDWRSKEYQYPEFLYLKASIIEKGEESAFEPQGYTFSGRKYDVEDMIAAVLVRSIYLSTECEIFYLDEGLKKMVAAYHQEEDMEIMVNGRSVPKRILKYDLYQVMDCLLVTDQFIYYSSYDEYLMLDAKSSERAIISDNYFAEQGYLDSLDNLKSGKEKLIWMHEEWCEE